MYAVFGALAVYALAPEHPLIWVAMTIAFLAAAICFAWLAPGDLNARMGILVSLVALRGFFVGSPGLALLALGLFSVAYLAWTFDRHLGRWGHATWHLFTAAAIVVDFQAITA